MKSFPTSSQKTPWSGGLARSRDKLNMLYLNYHFDYGYQIWQGGPKEWALEKRASFKGKIMQILNFKIRFENVRVHMKITPW